MNSSLKANFRNLVMLFRLYNNFPRIISHFTKGVILSGIHCITKSQLPFVCLSDFYFYNQGGRKRGCVGCWHLPLFSEILPNYRFRNYYINRVQMVHPHIKSSSYPPDNGNKIIVESRFQRLYWGIGYADSEDVIVSNPRLARANTGPGLTCVRARLH